MQNGVFGIPKGYDVPLKPCARKDVDVRDEGTFVYVYGRCSPQKIPGHVEGRDHGASKKLRQIGHLAVVVGPHP